ncbi:MAG: peptidase M20 [Anaerolineaceae bacterium 4572_32.2]|nr:MAG: peptidase M20 [Anaerolineaceae bacterium 4572_32.2]
MLKRAQQIKQKITGWRRDFHMHPELGFQETRTAARVAEELEALGCRVRTGVGRTGVVADLGSGSPIVAIRADMDALPLQENSDAPYASQIPGVMHACGHDAHTAIALGVATLLAQETFPGTVRFLFQPAEEREDDEGISGAPRMIEDGAMKNVDAVLALHVDASIPTGDVTVGAGPSSAGVDTFYATVIGRGGHGATPHKVVDPIHIAGHVILALNAIVSRHLNPFDQAVVSIGSIRGGHTDNVIPERVELCGTIRFMTSEVQQQIHTEIERALGVSKALGGDYELRIETGYPPAFNDAEIAELQRQVAADLLGAEHIREPEKSLGAEDFGFFSTLAPGAMFMLGSLIEGDERQHHNPHFDIDERCLPIGAAILAEAALRFLRQKGG